MTKRIPTNLVTGFLGAGKTTAVLNLLKRKSPGEKWAVLVNEFGEVGIDGAILRGQGAVVREVPGGCMCCVAGLPVQVALNRLISRERPDRLLIEPSGLGHPAQILSMLQGGQYQNLLEVRATLALVDPRKLSDPRYTGNISFRDQLNLADVLIGNKADLASESEQREFLGWADSFAPPKAAFGLASWGEFPLEWLDCPLGVPRTAEDSGAHSATSPTGADFLSPLFILSGLADEPLSPDGWKRVPGRGPQRQSCGWIFGEARVFRHDELYSFFCGLDVDRAKGVLQTDQGWQVFNLAGGVVSHTQVSASEDSRLEAIAMSGNADWSGIEQGLLGCLVTRPGG